MNSRVLGASIFGLDAVPIDVEVDNQPGLHTFNIVGLPDTGVKESRDRVSSAIKNSGFNSPRKFGRITVNLAPADLKKEGPLFDLPIALGTLGATKQLNPSVYKNRLFVGELSLDGRIRAINGALSIAHLASKMADVQELIIPIENAKEASIFTNIKITPAQTLRQVVLHLKGNRVIRSQEKTSFEKIINQQGQSLPFDMAQIKGQEHAKRALEIAAAGNHNILLCGPPGSGKTLLAKAYPSILPKPTFKESIEITKIHSVCAKLPKKMALLVQRPFRSPHHSASAVSLIGGGQNPRPGEISLAHRGVLFLDEFPEFARSVIENLRQPLEEGKITVSRAQGSITFPARFSLIAAMNPCPCGNLSDPEKTCNCPPSSILRYQQKISGPILDRIDIFIEVPRLKFEKLEDPRPQESSTEIRQRIERARNIQHQRFAKENILTNSEMEHPLLKKYCKLGEKEIELLRKAVSKLQLSPRAYNRILRVSRTIADLENSLDIKVEHIAEAIQFRERSYLSH